jgi:phosphate uptake regulator
MQQNNVAFDFASAELTTVPSKSDLGQAVLQTSLKPLTKNALSMLRNSMTGYISMDMHA